MNRENDIFYLFLFFIFYLSSIKISPPTAEAAHVA